MDELARQTVIIDPHDTLFTMTDRASVGAISFAWDKSAVSNESALASLTSEAARTVDFI